ESGKCVALHGEHIELIDLQEAVGTLKSVPLSRYATAQALFG
ncbi:6-phosphofructokinase, partial [Corynebacterium glucuronolyticum]|nr:6-phosphofructokinase [Corynebacterium glucuronolyticum]